MSVAGVHSVDLAAAVLSDHAREQIAERQITEHEVRHVLAGPERRFEVRRGRIAVQRLVMTGDPKRRYLIRVFVDIDREPPEVVTAYRTSKIDKYRSRS